MELGYLFVAAGLLLIVKGWIRVYFSGGQMVTDGIYAIMRHPQYPGIFIAIFGQLVHWPTIPTLLLAPLIVGIYVRLARREERHMIQKFGTRYLAYQRRVPMFIPNWPGARNARAG